MVFNSIADMFRQVTDKYISKKLYYYKKDGDWIGLSGKDIRECVENISYSLNLLNIDNDDKIAIMSNNSPKWAMTDYGIICSGAVTVSIYPTLIANQVEYILNNSGSKLIFVENAEQLDKIRSIWDNCSALEHIVVLDDSYRDDNTNIVNFTRFCNNGKDHSLKCTTTFSNMVDNSNSDSVLTIIYTSGTTGDPKGVILTHKNLLSNMEGIYKTQDFSSDDVFLSVLPLSHVFERMGGHFTSFSNGCTNYYAESIETVGENLGEVSPTVVLCVPRLFEKMYSKIINGLKLAPEKRQKIFWWGIDVGKSYFEHNAANQPIPFTLKLKHSIANKLVFSKVKLRLGGKLRFFISGGAPLSQEIAEFFAYAGIMILEGYGLTETSPVLTNNTPEYLRYGTVGKPLHNVEIEIAADGEILAKGPNIMKGYYNDPDATSEVIDSDGWFHTGDIGEIDKDGYLKITDRKKSIIVTSGGKNIAPAPLENAILLSNYIEQVIVIGDQRNFISALVVPAFDIVEAFLKEEDISLDENEAIIEHEKVIKLFENEVENCMSTFSRHERVKKISLSSRLFSIDKGELTPKMSIVRKVVLDNFSDKIDTIYSNNSGE